MRGMPVIAMCALCLPGRAPVVINEVSPLSVCCCMQPAACEHVSCWCAHHALITYIDPSLPCGGRWPSAMGLRALCEDCDVLQPPASGRPGAAGPAVRPAGQRAEGELAAGAASPGTMMHAHLLRVGRAHMLHAAQSTRHAGACLLPHTQQPPCWLGQPAHHACACWHCLLAPPPPPAICNTYLSQALPRQQAC